MVSTEVRGRHCHYHFEREQCSILIILFKKPGTFPNIGRNCIINVAETVVYDSVKDGFISSGYFVDGYQSSFHHDLHHDHDHYDENYFRFKCHLASAAVAGVTATLVASPVDVVKTR